MGVDLIWSLSPLESCLPTRLFSNCARSFALQHLAFSWGSLQRSRLTSYGPTVRKWDVFRDHKQRAQIREIP